MPARGKKTRRANQTMAAQMNQCYGMRRGPYNKLVGKGGLVQFEFPGPWHRTYTFEGIRGVGAGQIHKAGETVGIK